MENDALVREQLQQLLDGRNAHMTFDQAVAGFPLELINTRPPNVPYSFWHLVEHLRIAQWDILDFIKNPDYKERAWPAGYWPDPAAQATVNKWQESLSGFRADLSELKGMAQDTAVDLYEELPHAPGYTILREIMVVANHNSYHIGELSILRGVMAAWPE